ncbi:SubName: Full=Uncharacterized protein {ECO:0000313/EMBL:CCA73370.1} [Serendipita indica DSM 11827]|nr:SubName: Full=Uncharacterized protein {ECO:0000313/EMBL:CCA73370.1} [Serendipita indica DSM 11827]
MVFRPATPGFAVTLAATICLALASFSVPLLKSFYFLSATINHEGVQGTATFGVLGYCLQTGSSTACSNATVGWEFDPNALLGLNLPLNIEIPNVVVKWLTYVLVLHIVGLGLAAVSALFGLLAHIREMAMTCFSSCIAGLAASVTLLAFIFDLIFFFIIRARIRAVGGAANIGNALWLTLAAWVMLFLAGFFFGIGRCCFASRPRGPKGQSKKWYNGGGFGQSGPMETGGISHSEAMRLEAIKAENDRKARQAEVGLPAFPTNAEARPLKQKSGDAQYYVEEDSEDEGAVSAPHKPPYQPVGMSSGSPQRRGSVSTTYTSNHAGRGVQQVQPQYGGGYMQGPPGTRSIDAYNNNASQAPAFPSGPNQPYRQGSQHSAMGYTGGYNPHASSSSPPPMPVAQVSQQYLTPGGAAVGEVYGHGARQTSYHSAVSHQTGQPSSFSQYDQNQGYDAGYTQQNQGYGNAYQQPSQAYSEPYARTQSPPQQQQGGYHDPYSQPQTNPFYPPQPSQHSPIGHVAPPWNQPGNTLVNSGDVPLGMNVPPTTPTPAIPTPAPMPLNTYGGGPVRQASSGSGMGMSGMPGALPSGAAPPVPPKQGGGMIPSDAPPGYDAGAQQYPYEKR